MAEANLAIVETTIDEVTVFTNRAMVTRRGHTSLQAGPAELVVTNLPVLLDTDSIRAGGEGNVAVKIIGVRSERVFSVESVSESVAELEQQIESLERHHKEMKNQLQALRLQRDFIKGLSEKSVDRYSQSLARQQTDLEATNNLVSYVGTRWSQLSQEILRIETDLTKSEQQMTALRNKLQQLKTPRSQESISLFVSIEAAQPGEFSLEVSYFVNSASWKPLYDLRVDSLNNKVNLTYLAEVSQRSGEDWNNVSLVLSTAKPGLGTLPPKLSPWYLDVFQPVPPPPPMPKMAMRARSAAPAGQVMNFEGLEEFTLSDVAAPMASAAPVVAQSVEAEISNDSGGAVTFKVGRRNDIPSDGQPHKVTVFSDDYNCKLEFIAMPKLVAQTYLRATVTNGKAQLLPGSANIFRDNNFVGKTQLASVAPNEEIKLNLGIDESVKVERDLVEREVDKSFLNNLRRTNFAYRITLTNLREVETQVEVSDQMPLSRNEQIKVKMLRVQPLIQPGELNVLEWKITLPPKARREIYFQFQVEHPRDLNITGLGI